MQRVSGQGFEIAHVRRKHGRARFSVRDHDRIDCGAPARTTPQERCTSSDRYWKLRYDVATLEKAVRCRIATHMALEALHEYGGRHDRRPQALLPKRAQECRYFACSFGEPAHGT